MRCVNKNNFREPLMLDKIQNNYREPLMLDKIQNMMYVVWL